MHIIIVGGGIAGLSAGYHLTRAGHTVTVLEKEEELGGLARSFRVNAEVYLERYYHFICLNDYPLLNLLGELGLSQRLRWRYTGMGQFHEGVLYPFGQPWDLLTFAPFNLWERLRFGINIMRVKSRNSDGWRELENVPAPDWLVSQFGERAFNVIHKPLIELKFGQYASRLSAAWIWARFHRLGKSRTRWTQREKLGYIEGGMRTLIQAMADQIVSSGGRILTSVPVEQIVVERNRARGVVCGGETYPADAVISTIPSIALLQIVEPRDDPFFQILRHIDYIGVMCALLQLKHSFTRYFWTNISDQSIPLAGIIEYTNLNPCPDLNGSHIVYLPLYVPSTSKRYAVADGELLREYVSYLQKIRPEFDESWIEDWWVFRDEYAQPICEVGFTKCIPPITSSIEGLYVTDSCQLHPEDRTVANSIGLGIRAAKLVIEGANHRGFDDH